MQSKTRSTTIPGLRERWKILLVLLLALIQGLIHFFLLPPWQHYDEPTHFEYAWLIANRGELPDTSAMDHNMRREVVVSMQEHNFFWNLAPPDLLSDDKVIWIGISELVHPPAYYVLTSIPVYLTRHLDITTQLYAARGTSLLMFLLIIGVTIGIMRDIVPRNHPLRWLVPLTVLLLPPFASHMTAINNDVGAVLIFSFFLWGAVRLIRYGLSLWRVLWVIAAVGIAIQTKNTAMAALVMLPLVLLMSVWVQFQWRWRWFCLGAITLGAFSLIGMLDVGDAAYWYRNEWGDPQVTSNRQPSRLSPNEYAVSIEVAGTAQNHNMLNPLLPEHVEQIKGQTVTIGGWLWADEAVGTVQTTAPGLIISAQGTNKLIPLRQSIEATSTPTFFAHTYQIPDDTQVVYYSFWANNVEERSEPFQLYLDDAFLIAGELSEEELASVEPNSVPTAIQEHNLIRNPSAEQTWLRLRPWTHALVVKALRRSPSYIFNALVDIQKSGPLIFGRVAPFLIYDFFAAFAWGHVRLDAQWISFFYFLIAIALIGSIRGLITYKQQPDQSRYPTLFFLALTVFIVWGATLMWPLPYQWARTPLPSARYLYTSIIPTAFIFAGGWWALWPKAYRHLGILLWIGILFVLNAVSINTISSFYNSLPVT